MKYKKTIMTRTLLWGAAIGASVLLMGSGPANAQEGILYRVRAGDSNYCHLKFPAIRPDTLTSGRPVLQNPNTGDIVDFYGACSHNPIGQHEVEQQKRSLQRHLAQE
jgi:hypothetical protein